MFTRQKNLLVLGMVGILVLVSRIDVWSQEIVEAEELLFLKLPMVVTAARHEQPIKESPSSISVITSEDIRLCEADNIPDLLRRVAGMDVMMMNAYQSEVSARGFNKILSDKMLVLIDGRIQYQKGNFWRSVPLIMEEIERIEIIRGPGSALYGADAFCGVINIISKTPEDLKGSRISVRYGEYETVYGSFIHAGVTDKFGWKVSVNWDETNQWWDKHKDAYRIGKGNIQIDYHPDNDSILSLTCSYVDNKDVELGSGFGTLDGDSEESSIQVKYQTKNLKLQSFYRHPTLETIQQTTSDTNQYVIDLYDIDFQHSVALLEKNMVVWGGNYRRYTRNKEALLLEDHAQDLYAGFLQDEYRLMDNLIFFAGTRYDYHPLVKGHLSPRASMIYSPTEKHSLRISAGTAFGNPTILQSYMHKDTIKGAATYQYYGNENLKPEEICSYEFGYSIFPSERIKAKMDLFVNQCKDFIQATNWKLISNNPKIYYRTIENRGKMLGIGGEIEFDLLLTNWLTSNLNYSYQKYTHEEDDPVLNKKKGDEDKSMPRHKINTELRFKPTSEIAANLSAHYVDDAEWPEGKVDDYTIVNGRIGYRLPKYDLEIFLAGFNIFDNKHYEYAPGSPPLYPAAYPLSDKIGRKITVGVNYGF